MAGGLWQQTKQGRAPTTRRYLATGPQEPKGRMILVPRGHLKHRHTQELYWPYPFFSQKHAPARICAAGKQIECCRTVGTGEFCECQSKVEARPPGEAATKSDKGRGTQAPSLRGVLEHVALHRAQQPKSRGRAAHAATKKRWNGRRGKRQRKGQRGQRGEKRHKEGVLSAAIGTHGVGVVKRPCGSPCC